MPVDPSASRGLLANIPAFADLEVAVLDLIAAELDEQQLPDGAVLMRQGEPADALYFVIAGQAEVSFVKGAGQPVVVDRLQAGSVIGEMAMLAGNRRTATVTARGPVTVARFTRAAFEKLAAGSPKLRQRVVAAITPRLERIELAGILEPWFGVGANDTKVIQQLQDSTEFVTLPGGGTLYGPGDAADGMYLVASGRLQVRTGGEENPRVFQVARGESVGELGVLGGGLRAETVTALRDSHLLHVPTAVVEAHPSVMARIARTTVERLGSSRRSGVHGSGLRTLALLPAHSGAPVRDLAALLETQLNSGGRALLIDEAYVTNAFGGYLRADDSVLDTALTHWLNDLEAEHDYIVLIADAGSRTGTDTARRWADRCRRQADAVLLVADATAEPETGFSTVPPGAQLALVHPPGTEFPSGTAAWLDRTGSTEWHHVRAGDGYGVASMVRRLTGHAVGLVFSGGGARGYAHIGLLRAVEELGLEVDMLAGTSMGALIAATFAYTGSSAEVQRAAVMFGDKKRLLDRTLPLVALTKSHGVTSTFRSIFGDSRIEDLWTPFVCVSANLFEAVPMEHNTGPIWEAVRASSAIPGVFTPVVSDGALLVDGAIMNAFPVDIMRDLVGNGTVIASSVMAKSARREPFDFGPSISGWRALAEYLKPRSRRTQYPTLIKTLMEATSVGSKHQSVAARKLADLVVEHPVSGFSKLGFHRHAELIELGYRHALAELTAWRQAELDAATTR